jgi:hypothetical protein
MKITVLKSINLATEHEFFKMPDHLRIPELCITQIGIGVENDICTFTIKVEPAGISKIEKFEDNFPTFEVKIVVNNKNYRWVNKSDFKHESYDDWRYGKVLQEMLILREHCLGHDPSFYGDWLHIIEEFVAYVDSGVDYALEEDAMITSECNRLEDEMIEHIYKYIVTEYLQRKNNIHNRGEIK